jgi:hypothetical protein
MGDVRESDERLDVVLRGLQARLDLLITDIGEVRKDIASARSDRLIVAGLVVALLAAIAAILVLAV